MKWTYEIHWIDGWTETIVSSRLTNASKEDRNLIIYLNEHGHDRRFDFKVIPLGNVRSYDIKEIQ